MNHEAATTILRKFTQSADPSLDPKEVAMAVLLDIEALGNVAMELGIALPEGKQSTLEFLRSISVPAQASAYKQACLNLIRDGAAPDLLLTDSLNAMEPATAFASVEGSRAAYHPLLQRIAQNAREKDWMALRQLCRQLVATRDAFARSLALTGAPDEHRPPDVQPVIDRDIFRAALACFQLLNRIAIGASCELERLENLPFDESVWAEDAFIHGYDWRTGEDF